ncbi:hypothetical protein J2Z18_000485 [Paenibacillus lactis]|uniref:Uncharacterized protein n=1 Tax=Paenibacillus lactis TaxID=228574 RepID=A0ABS4F583_9BACL|nr:hypothetical protein [Paenibacillus lactis]
MDRILEDCWKRSTDKTPMVSKMAILSKEPTTDMRCMRRTVFLLSDFLMN